MRRIAEALLTAEGTRARTAKVAALGTALADVAKREPAQLAFVTRFLTGALLPVGDERTLGTGGALVFEAAAEVARIRPEDLGTLARAAGDLGTAVGQAFEGRMPETELRIADVVALAETLAGSSGRTEKLRALIDALGRSTPLEARYVVRAVLGEMRVGAREGIVEEAIARAFRRALEDIRHASGFLADVGEVAQLAFEDRLGEARIRLGRPMGFMLATPIDVAKGADLTVPHAIEDKIDGIRAQAHVMKDGVHLFARGKGSVTLAFPDVTGPLAAAGLSDAILDGEIVVVAPDGRPRPFSAIQPRLKKTVPDEQLLRDHPVRYVVYDLMYEAGEALLSLPFSTRRTRLQRWAERAPVPLVVHDSRPLVSRESLDAEFDAARSRGFEGLVLKRLDAPYSAGVRGFSWLKVKKALATLDVVIVAAERGHGRRAGVLSDYTFAVRDADGELKTIGKAYSGLTDVEIASMTERLQRIALGEERRGRLPVRPEVVLEVAFDGLQRSDRHSSGFALRFPRIERIRDDKTPDDADTLETVKKLWDAQLASGHREDLVAKKGRKSGRRPDVRQKSKQLKLFEDD